MSEVLEWNPGEANPKQKLFFASRKLYTGYGGAKGGGKTWAVRTKALLGAYNYPGIRILVMRRTYPELQSNHIEPMLKLIRPELASYNGSLHTVYFVNGSLIHFGHWSGEESELEYNGQEYDWIFLDEATQFTWRAFQFLGGLLRGVNDIPKRMYVTCNPGGVGHRWVKRLFIDREYITGCENPEENENPDDYVFIPATVEDNTALLKSSPGYLRMLSSMPENLRRAYRYGDWESLGGNYFPELSEAVHVSPVFRIPGHWKRYRAFDYGLEHVCLRLVCGGRAGQELDVPGVFQERADSTGGGEGDAGADAAGGADRGHVRAAGHVVEAEGLRAYDGGDLLRVRRAHSARGQLARAGAHDDKGPAGQKAGRAPVADVL